MHEWHEFEGYGEVVGWCTRCGALKKTFDMPDAAFDAREREFRFVLPQGQHAADLNSEEAWSREEPECRIK